MDIQQIVQQIMGNQDLLGQLSGMGGNNTDEAKQAIRDAGIPVSSNQMGDVMGMLSGVVGNIDPSSVMQGVDLSDGFDMKDVQGIMGGLFGGKR